MSARTIAALYVALGPKGAVLGLTPLLGRGVRKQARSNLDAYPRANTGT